MIENTHYEMAPVISENKIILPTIKRLLIVDKIKKNDFKDQGI